MDKLQAAEVLVTQALATVNTDLRDGAEMSIQLNKLTKAIREYNHAPQLAQRKAPALTANIQLIDGENLVLETYYSDKNMLDIFTKICRGAVNTAFVKRVHMQGGGIDGVLVPTLLEEPQSDAISGKATTNYADKKFAADTRPQIWVSNGAGTADSVTVLTDTIGPQAGEIFWYINYHLQRAAESKSTYTYGPMRVELNEQAKKLIQQYEDELTKTKPYYKGPIYGVATDQIGVQSFSTSNAVTFYLRPEWNIRLINGDNVEIWKSIVSKGITTKIVVNGKVIFDHPHGQIAALKNHLRAQIKALGD